MTPSSPPPVSTAPGSLSLEQQVCYSMHTTVRAFDAVYRELLAEHGLSYPQYIALMTVGQHGPLTVGSLGELLRLDSGTLSPLLKRMAAAGLVDRVRDATDERRVLVSLSAAGRTLLDRLVDVPATIARRSGLTRAEMTALHETLRTVSDRLEGTMPT
jgi:MarR family transcriptional regulator, organic hydroperoxide resistance regulator